MKRLLLAMAFSANAICANENWPQFRGPNGDGHSDSKGLPIAWSEEKNVKWKTPIHGRGWASPVVLGNQVWIATATEDGRELSAVCVDRESGKVIHDLKLFDVEKPQFCHKFNSYASPTPVIEDGRIYVTFGSPGTACVDTKTGKLLWQRRDFECNHYRGAGSSPILFQNLLIMHFDGSDRQFIVALEKATGNTKWAKERSIDFDDLGADGKPEIEGDLRKAFSTPHVAEFDGKPLLISSGAKAHYAYEPLTGKELWRVEERTSHSASTRPVVGQGVVYIPTGFSKGTLLAIRPGKRGEVVDANNPDTQTATQLQVLWKGKRNVPNKPSVLFIDDLLFMVDDSGIASCLDARTGDEVWRERVGGNYSAAPLYADGRLYFFNEEGKTAIVAAKREFKLLAENQLGDGVMASPAAAGKALFLRSRTHLYRIEE